MFRTSFFILRGSFEVFCALSDLMFYKGDFLLHITTTRGMHVLSLKYIHGKVYTLSFSTGYTLLTLIYNYQFVDSLEFAGVRFHIIYFSVQWSKLLARPLDNSNLF